MGLEKHNKVADIGSLEAQLEAGNLSDSSSTISLDSPSKNGKQNATPKKVQFKSTLKEINAELNGEHAGKKDGGKGKESLKEKTTDDSLKSLESEKMSLAALEEQKELKKECNSFTFEMSMDILDVYLKCQDFYIFMKSVEEQIEYFKPLLSALTIASIIIFFSTIWRLKEVREMRFVAAHGYSRRWKKGERIVGTGSGTDPRVARDMKDRLRRQQYLTSFQAFFSDLPWLTIGIFQGSTYVLNTFGILSISSSAFGFGMKFTSIIDLIKEGLKKKVPLFTVCPAEIKIGSGCSYDEDASEAMNNAYNNAVAECGTGEGKHPSLVLVFMTANVEHAKALEKLNELTEGKVPYSGSTICRGAMMGTLCRQNDDMRLVAVWVLNDPEGLYEVGMADLNQASNNDEIHTVVAETVRNTEQICKKKALEDPDNPVVHGNANFVWINPPPGPEDIVIAAVQEGIGSPNVEIIGGTSADNDVSGSWKQWNSKTGVVTNGMPFVIARCSAQLKGCAFTGYSATPKVGKVTKMNGPRHIITIDDKPAGQVYDDWTSGHFKDLWEDPEDSNILGPSSVYPLGQVVSQDWDNEDVHRTLHPHLLVKKDRSLTVFSDVHEGQEICMMTRTKENIQTKISAVATHVLRSTGIPTSELRGALVVFCAGAMMYVEKEGVGVACGKLDQSLGGVNYLGIHTFGEQGPFPDGSVRHGNLMFSALVFSSRRKIMKLSNLDIDEFVLETDPKFKEIALSGGIIGGAH